MKKSAKLLRWGALLISLFVEAAVFWLVGPAGEPALGIWNTLWVKAQSSWTWTAVGFAALSLFWFWVELTLLSFFIHARIRKLARDTNGEVTYETGLHWLVLRRDVWTGQLLDGDARELDQSIDLREIRRDPKHARHSLTWYAVWYPIYFAGVTALFYLGWLAWLIGSFPARVAQFAEDARALVNEHIGLWLVGAPIDAVLRGLPSAAGFIRDHARGDGLWLFEWIIGIWLGLLILRHVLKRWRNPLARLLAFVARIGIWLVVLTAVLALHSLPAFDFLVPVYTFLPNNGPVAMGFFPLTLAAAFLVPHIIYWASWRYALIRDPRSLDGALYTTGGVFNSELRQSSFERIVDMSIHQDWWERLLSIGDVTLVMTGGEGEQVRHIMRPNRLYQELNRCIAERRRGGRSASDD